MKYRLYALRVFSFRWKESLEFYRDIIGFPVVLSDESIGWAQFDLGTSYLGLERCNPGVALWSISKIRMPKSSPCSKRATSDDSCSRFPMPLTVTLWPSHRPSICIGQKKYGLPGRGSRYARTMEEESELWQWTLWSQGQLEPWVQKDLLLCDLIKTIGSKGQAMIERSLDLLERVLQQREWLVGEHFTVADLNVAGVLSPSRSSQLDLSRFPQVSKWLTRCYSRPAAVDARRRYAHG